MEKNSLAKKLLKIMAITPLSTHVPFVADAAHVAIAAHVALAAVAAITACPSAEPRPFFSFVCLSTS